MNPENSPEQRSPSWPLYLIGGLFVAGFLSVVAWNIELPYLAYSPGPISDAADTVVAEEVDFFPPEGELLMLTILQQDVNVFEAFIAGVDPTIDLVRKQAVRREGESDQEYRNRVLDQMSSSNFRAVTVALQYLGYEMVPVEVIVTEVEEGVPAAGKIEQGDIVRSINGDRVTSFEDFEPALEGYDVGDTISLTVEREAGILELEVELAEREEEPGEPMIGITLRPVTEPPFPIEIRAGDVGGPSAGLMHTLAIIDNLTEGELTKGRVIAGTGTIDLGGTVGSIGGIRQKVVAAEAAGADYLLVPEGNYETALTAERETIEIVAVATLDDAISFLEGLEAA